MTRLLEFAPKTLGLAGLFGTAIYGLAYVFSSEYFRQFGLSLDDVGLDRLSLVDPAAVAITSALVVVLVTPIVLWSLIVTGQFLGRSATITLSLPCLMLLSIGTTVVQVGGNSGQTASLVAFIVAFFTFVFLIIGRWVLRTRKTTAAGIQTARHSTSVMERHAAAILATLRAAWEQPQRKEYSSMGLACRMAYAESLASAEPWTEQLPGARRAFGWLIAATLLATLTFALTEIDDLGGRMANQLKANPCASPGFWMDLLWPHSPSVVSVTWSGSPPAGVDDQNDLLLYVGERDGVTVLYDAGRKVYSPDGTLVTAGNGSPIIDQSHSRVVRVSTSDLSLQSRTGLSC